MRGDVNQAAGAIKRIGVVNGQRHHRAGDGGFIDSGNQLQRALALFAIDQGTELLFDGIKQVIDLPSM